MSENWSEFSNALMASFGSRSHVIERWQIGEFDQSDAQGVQVWVSVKLRDQVRERIWQGSSLGQSPSLLAEKLCANRFTLAQNEKSIKKKITRWRRYRG